MKQIVWMSWFLLLGACKQAVVPAPLPPAAPVQAKSTTPYATGVAAAQVTSPAEQAASFLALDSEGLRLFNSMTGASRLLAFGTAGADALRMIGIAHKAPVKTSGRNEECRASTTTYGDGLTVWIAGERFVGWSAAAPAATSGSDLNALRSDPEVLTTAAGIKVGSTRSELDSAYAIKVVQSTLGTEFSAGAMAGVLASDRKDARITALWAGMTCIAR
jgi:hypothetical protein